MSFLKKAIPTLAAERRDLKHDGYLHLLEARRGRGKSYNLTYLAREGVFAHVPVIANFGLNRYRLAVQAFMAGRFRSIGAAMDWVYENVTIAETWDDLLTAHDSLILLDEASRIFDSRNRSAPPVAFEFFQQSRKLKLTLVLASQSFDWLDVRIRQLADVLWMVRKETDKRSGNPVRFWLYGLDPYSKGLSETVLRDRADYRSSVPFRPEVATLYNSWELIRVISGEPSWKTMGELTEYHLAAGHISTPFYLHEHRAERREGGAARSGPWAASTASASPVS